MSERIRLINSEIPLVIPSYEPNSQLLDLLKALRQKQITNILIVDDGSSAEYQHFFDEAQKEFGAMVLHHEVNRGKGAALKTAFAWCLQNLKDLTGVVTADSDGQHAPEDIMLCMEKLYCAFDCLVMGARDFTLPNVPEKSKWGNEATNKIMKALYGLELADTQTGLRGIPKHFMEKLLDVKGDRFEYEMRMITCAWENNVMIEEVPIQTVYDSKDHHSTHFRPLIDTLEIYKVFGLFKAFAALAKDKLHREKI